MLDCKVHLYLNHCYLALQLSLDLSPDSVDLDSDILLNLIVSPARATETKNRKYEKVRREKSNVILLVYYCC